jgi:hypothetical protein
MRIIGQFSLAVDRVHIRYDVWGPDNLNTAGAMLGCIPLPETTALTTAKLGRWVRASQDSAPYEVPDGALFGYQWPGEAVYLNLHNNTDWRDKWSINFPAVKAEAGHFVAEGDLVITSDRPAAVGALLAARPLAVDIWTDKPNNIWTTGDQPFDLKTQTVNTAPVANTVTLNWTARNFDGMVVASGALRRALDAGEAWNHDISIPAPKEGIVFVDVSAATATASVFSRTNLAVLPPHKYLSGDNSLFGISAYFPLPSEDAAENLMKRIGVRWFRDTKITDARARELGFSQNHHVGGTPNGQPDDLSANPSEKKAFIDRELSDADQHGARYLELFNEWNMTGGIGKGKLADSYVKDWLVPFSKERTQSGSRVKIMSMGLAGADMAWIDKLHDDGGWNRFDAFALHTGRGWYTADYGGDEHGPTPGADYWNFLGTIQTVNAVMAKYGRKDLWITEAYACTAPNNAWFDTYRNAAENVVLSYALADAEGVRVMQWYQLNDSVWYDQGGVNDKDSEYHYGLLNYDLSPKPSALAYATIAAALDQARFERWIQFGKTRTKGLLFDTPRGRMTILWDRSDGYRLNTTIDTPNKQFESPEPWVDEWKTKVTINVPSKAKTISEIDCIGREKFIPVKAGYARITLDGAPRIFYGISPR